MGTDRQFRLARLWSNVELRRLGHLFTGEMVNVSAGEDLDKEGGTYADYFPGRSAWFLTNYQAGSYRGFAGRPNEFLVDLEQPLPAELDQRFDLAFNHTTLEHVFEVHTAFGNICRMSRDIVIVVVPFSQVQHESTGFADYWRLTPSCLRELFRRNGMEVVYEAESPDVDASVYLLMVGSRQPGRWRGKMPEWKPLATAGRWIGRQPRGWLKRLLALWGR